MAKAKHSLIKNNQFESLIRSKRTIKKSGGDDFTDNVRCVRMKSKKSGEKNAKAKVIEI